MKYFSQAPLFVLALIALPVGALAAEPVPAVKAPTADAKAASTPDAAAPEPRCKRAHKPIRIAYRLDKPFSLCQTPAGHVEVTPTDLAGPVPDGEMLLEDGVKIRVKDGIVVEGPKNLGTGTRTTTGQANNKAELL